MERFSGAIVVLAGVALGAYSFLPSTDDAADHQAEIARIATATQGDGHLVASPTVVPSASARKPEADSTNSARVFSPSAPLVTSMPGATGASTTTWSAVVTPERSSGVGLKSARAGDPEARALLTSDLQRELKRVGCYEGEINGAWTQSTRRAMAAFMDRVNATLPAKEPDYILLTLVQSHATLVCSSDCPAGEAYNNDGRCLPAAVVAQSSRRAQRLEERMAERREREQRKAAQQEQLAAEQRANEARRVAVAQRNEADRLAAQREKDRRKTAQRIEDQRLAAERANAERVVAAASRNDVGVTSSKVATVNSERLPWLENAPVARDEQRTTDTATTVATTQRGEPLPGMMAVGAARPTPDAIAATGSVGETAAKWPTPTVTRDSVDRDDLSAARGYTLTAPVPQPAERPAAPSAVREAALVAGLPGTKAGTSEASAAYDNQEALDVRKYAPAKIVRRPVPYEAAPRVKRKNYAYNSGGKTRRGQPRPGTPRFNLMQSLGGIY